MLSGWDFINLTISIEVVQFKLSSPSAQSIQLKQSALTKVLPNTKLDHRKLFLFRVLYTVQHNSANLFIPDMPGMNCYYPTVIQGGYSPTVYGGNITFVVRISTITLKTQ